jgi:hypothetical protein
MWRDCEYCISHEAMPIAFTKEWDQLRNLYPSVSSNHHACLRCVRKMLSGKIRPVERDDGEQTVSDQCEDAQGGPSGT